MKNSDQTSFRAMLDGVERTGKPGWRDMLRFVAGLHSKSVHRPAAHFPYPWEEIGPGYCYGPAFGHWDIVHAVMDAIPFEPEHARHQILNNLAAQTGDGLVPGVVWMREGKAEMSRRFGHPPVWVFAVQDFARLHGPDILRTCFNPLLKQIEWFEKNRKADGFGFFYLDILTNDWESGVDEGIRFLQVRKGPLACIDASSHMFALYDMAAKWAVALGGDPGNFRTRAEELCSKIQSELFSDDTGFFHDIWSVDNQETRCLSFEGMWPVVVGAATQEQARRVIEENLLNPERFLSRHPITSVSMNDRRFELRCWRGPAWNSMTFWAARGCILYGFSSAARILLERALDCSAAQFAATGTVWEFYHPDGGPQESVHRKPSTQFDTPCRDYLGHNPLIAMALLYDSLAAS